MVQHRGVCGLPSALRKNAVTRTELWSRTRLRGDASVSKVAELLERKQTLIERKQEQPNPEQVTQIERDLQKIDTELNRLEENEVDAPPTAPH